MNRSDWDDLTAIAQQQIGNMLLYTFWASGPVALAIIGYSFGGLVWAAIGAFLGLWIMLIITEYARLLIFGRKLAEQRARIIAEAEAGK